MSREQIDKLLYNARFANDPYLSEWSGNLEIALKRHDSLTRAKLKSEVWSRVLECVRRIEGGFQTLEARRML